jgi:hypothetical protein
VSLILVKTVYSPPLVGVLDPIKSQLKCNGVICKHVQLSRYLGGCNHAMVGKAVRRPTMVYNLFIFEACKA